MSAVIRLDLMLREAVTTPYRDLVTRPTGVAVRHRVLLALRETGEGDALLDFSEVGLVDFSCADEVVAKLMTDAALPGRRVILRGLRDDQAEAIEHALARQGLAIIALESGSGGPHLIGAASDDCRAVFATVLRLGRTPAPPVAEHLAWAAERAALALETLARQRCLRQHPDATYECGELA